MQTHWNNNDEVEKKIESHFIGKRGCHIIIVDKLYNLLFKAKKGGFLASTPVHRRVAMIGVPPNEDLAFV